MRDAFGVERSEIAKAGAESARALERMAGARSKVAQANWRLRSNAQYAAKNGVHPNRPRNIWEGVPKGQPRTLVSNLRQSNTMQGNKRLKALKQFGEARQVARRSRKPLP